MMVTSTLLHTQFEQYIKTEGLFARGNRLLLALSGGVDSMVLLKLLLMSGYEVHAAHANFNLRGNDSLADELLVKEYCNENNVTLHCTNLDTAAYMEVHGTGLQETARNLRYSWFNKLLADHHLDYILTAHHADDLAETIILNLVRGSSVKALAGIRPKTGNRRRPLLFTTKEVLVHFAAHNRVPFRNDVSNEKDMYSRNYTRHHIIPHLLRLNPGFINSMQHFSRLMTATEYYYRAGIAQASAGLLTQHENNTSINFAALYKAEQAPYVLFELIHDKGFNFKQCCEMLDAYNQHHTGARFISPGYQAVLNREELIIAEHVHERADFLIDHFPFAYKTAAGTCCFHLQPYHGGPFLHAHVYVDASTLKYPLRLRNVLPGDKIIPLGMQHHKKISDYLTDRKIDRISKEKALVLLNAGNDIIALIPYQVAEHYKVSATCNEVLHIWME